MTNSVFETISVGTNPTTLELDEIVHDLNNLLYVIGMSAELGLAQPLDRSPARDMFEQIRDACGEASQLANTLLTTGDRAALQQRHKCFDLSEMIENALPLLIGSVNRTTQLKCELAAEPVMITGNPIHFRQILTNLVLNASQSLEDGSGLIVVSTGFCDLNETSCEFITGHLVSESYSFLEVADSGCGMDEATQARLFEPHFTTKRNGHGLGTASVRRITNAYNGAIRIHSKLGAGTRVRVFFPASERQEPDLQVSGDISRDVGNGRRP